MHGCEVSRSCGTPGMVQGGLQRLLGGPIGANGLQKTFRTALRVLTAAEICAHRVLKQLGQARCACHGFQATLTVLVFDCPIISSEKYLYNSIAKETNQIPA